MRLLFVTHYFPPEVGATQSRLGEVTAALARRGHHVTVIAPFPHYPDGRVPNSYRGSLIRREERDGVHVVRTWVLAVPNSAVLRRTLDYASFAATAIGAARAAGPADLVIGETPPLPAALAGYAISRLARCPFVCNVADLWVSSAVAIGALRRPAAIRTGRLLERFVYNRSACVTAVTEGVRAALEHGGIPAEKLHVIPNGVDTRRFHPTIDGSRWRSRLAKPDELLVVYAGNHGLAQGLGVVLESARLLRDTRNVRIVLVGDGAEKTALKAQATRQALSNVVFVPPQPFEAMPELLAAADVCIAVLRKDDVFRSAVPSKLFEAMAVARPVVIAADGEAAMLVERAHAGLAVRPGSPEALAGALCRVHDDPDLRRRLGESGRRFVEAEHDRERLVDAYERLYRSLGRSGTSGR